MVYDQPTIPRKGISEPSMQVYRPSSSGPSSSTNPDEQSLYEHQSQNPDHEPDHRSTTPPPYSGPTTTTMVIPPAAISAPQQPIYPGLPRLDYRLYSPPSFTLSQDLTTITSHEPRLSIYPHALVSLIKSLATVPPKPLVRIVGRTSSNTSSESSIDFDIKLNMMNLIVPDGEKTGYMNYVKVIGDGEIGLRGGVKPSLIPDHISLEEWARRYCEDSSQIKHFVLERVLTNLDTSYLEGRLLSLVNSTNYKGHVSITFPLTHAKVLVHSPDKVNRFFSNVTKIFAGTKKYEVVKAIWPFADVPRGEANRNCAVQEEDTWFSDWQDAIKHAVVMKRRGWVTVEDRLEFLMEPKQGEAAKPEWGLS